MLPEEQNEFIGEFLSESEEHLQLLNEKMLALEESIKSGQEMSENELNAMFRAAHTIKGTASFIELHKVVRLTHKTETLLQKLRDKETKLSQEIVDILFSAFDKLTALLQSLKEKNTEEADIDEEVEQIEKILNNLQESKENKKENKKEEQEKEKVTQGKEAPKSNNIQINEKYKEQFISEVSQSLETLDELFVTAEKEKDNCQVVNEIFRLIHSIKGSAGIINISKISEVAHKMENILAFYRENKKSIDTSVSPVLFSSLDLIRSMINSLSISGNIEIDILSICKELDNSYKNITSQKDLKPEVKVPDAEKFFDLNKLSEDKKSILISQINKDNDIFFLILRIENAAPLKSMKAAIAKERLDKNGVIIDINPPIEATDNIEGDVDICLIFASIIGEKDIRSKLSIDQLEVVSIERIDKHHLDKISGVENKNIKVEEHTSEVKKEIPMENSSTETRKEVSTVKTTAPVNMSTIKIDSRKLDTLMNLSGELVIIRAQFARLVSMFYADILQQKQINRINDKIFSVLDLLDKEFENNEASDKSLLRIKKITSEIRDMFKDINDAMSKSNVIENIHTLDETTNMLEKVSSNIQEGVMQTRMVPIEGVFTRFKRIVRDISKEINKEVDLRIEGQETELDKKIVDGLGDPLTHMIRNAVDHGIDDRETRLKLGKPEIGSVLLKASHKGNNICIEIGDDGRGMDTNKLVEIAIRKGILTREQSDKMNEREKLDIIFLPGFSTAQQVTGLSGRGVGMDVVRNMISSFNGFVDIETELNFGTKFILKIPLTLAIIQSLLVDIGEQVYAFPLESVTEIIKVSPDEIYSIDGNATVKIRNHALSIVELSNVIRISANKLNNDESKKIVIITDGDNQLGVVVDKLIGKEEIVIKSFSDHFSNVKGLTGASILADGSVALILDPITIIKESK